MEVSRVVLRDKFDSLTGNFAQLGSLGKIAGERIELIS